MARNRTYSQWEPSERPTLLQAIALGVILAALAVYILISVYRAFTTPQKRGPVGRNPLWKVAIATSFGRSVWDLFDESIASMIS